MGILKVLVVSILMLLIRESASEDVKPDPNGYVVFCPIKGEFGYNIDLYLGTISFIMGLRRTIVLPPFIIEKTGLVPFDTYFSLEPFRKFYGKDKVILMEEFMEKLAPTVWPQEKRICFCKRYMRGGSKKDDCNPKQHSPNRMFWGDIEFEGSTQFKSLGFDTRLGTINIDKWNSQYPVEEYPVLAFYSPPTKFPITREDVELHIMLEWTDAIKDQAAEFIKTNLPTNFLGIDIKQREIMKESCKVMKKHKMKQLMASPQCLGYHGYRTLEMDVCDPSDGVIIEHVVSRVTQDKLDAVFIICEDKDLTDHIQSALEVLDYKVAMVTSTSDTQVDLAIIEQADHYIGYCASYHSSFTVRARRQNNKPVEFWGFERTTAKDEL